MVSSGPLANNANWSCAILLVINIITEFIRAQSLSQNESYGLFVVSRVRVHEAISHAQNCTDVKVRMIS